MLLLIVIANTPWFLWGSPHGPGSSHPSDGSVLDRIVQGFTVIAVDMRVYPMFAFLFGYGMVQFSRSREARGFAERPIRRMLRQRHWAMFGIGLLHAALLWFGDVIGTYGLAGLLLVWIFFRRRTRTLKVWIAILVGLGVVGTAFSLVGGWFVATSGAAIPQAGGYSDAVAVNAITSYPASVLARVVSWLPLTATGVMTTVIPILVAWVWGRSRVLDEPGQHLHRLRLTAAIGVPVGWLGAVPSLLVHFEVLPRASDYWWAFSGLQGLTGMACGIGYVSVFALVAHRIGSRGEPGRVARVLEAVGQNSMTCYLGQSLLVAPLFAAWGVGLGAWMGSAATFLIAILVWVVWAVVASLLARSGRRGPAERLLRHLTYAGVARP